jgi:hypothetical protein
MKVKTETPDLLVLEDRPLFASLLLAAFFLADAAAVIALALQGDWAGVGMLGLGLPLLVLAAFFFVRRTIVFLDRPGNRVTIRTATLRRQTEDTLPLDRVTGAEVQVGRGSGTPTRRAALVLAGGGMRELTQVYSSGGGASRAVAAINRWLGKPG